MDEMIKRVAKALDSVLDNRDPKKSVTSGDLARAAIVAVCEAVSIYSTAPDIFAAMEAALSDQPPSAIDSTLVAEGLYVVPGSYGITETEL